VTRRDGLAVFALLALAALAVVPLGRSESFVLLLGTRAVVFAVAAMGLDLLVGAGGLPSFGHAAYLAIGAYTVAAADLADRNTLGVVLPVALLAAAVFAGLTGAISLRTRGVQFLMITLAFAQMVYFTAGSLAMLGADDGYTLVARTTVFGRGVLEDGRTLYLASLLCLTATYLLCRLVVASRFGRVLRAARQSELRVRAVGLDLFRVQWLALVLAGMIAALAGVLLANATEFVSPAEASWQRSGDLLVMVILGGAGSLIGAVFGAAAVVAGQEWLSQHLEHWRLIYAPLLVTAVLVRRRDG
jgi:branched-chain amino acid transport system permease protein